ncbi:MAG TPA: hypothetical protein VE465_24780 [Streptosporangiaceae bacterium]|jgi:hypothetical protein|nr:hypothetical protein [Streptosporangiaceae bacterium]
MRHVRDGAAAAIDAAARVLAVRGKSEPPEMENPDVAWAGQAREGVWAPTKDGQRIHIAIACGAADRMPVVLRPSLRVFVDVATGTDIVAQTTASGVRLVTVIRGPEAPQDFRFPITLGESLALEAMPSGGFDVVHERYGATVGRFYSAWAFDSYFRPVDAEYDLEDSTIVMRIRHKDVEYPVVADPLYEVYRDSP